MQQHTGQHVLSAAFDRVCQARTESFHLGTASATIDLGREVSPVRDCRRGAGGESRGLGRPSGAACASSMSAKPRRCRCARSRRAAAGCGSWRVEGFDLSACGGTHVVAHGRHRQHQRCLVRAVPRRDARRVPLRHPDAARLPCAARHRRCREPAALHRCRRSASGDRTAPDRQQRCTASREGPAGTARAARGAQAGRATALRPERQCVVDGARRLGRRRPEDNRCRDRGSPGSCRDSRGWPSPPRARRRARGRRDARCRRDREGAHGEVRRQGRRPARAGAGRRAAGVAEDVIAFARSVISET